MLNRRDAADAFSSINVSLGMPSLGAEPSGQAGLLAVAASARLAILDHVRTLMGASGPRLRARAASVPGWPLEWGHDLLAKCSARCQGVFVATLPGHGVGPTKQACAPTSTATSPAACLETFPTPGWKRDSVFAVRSVASASQNGLEFIQPAALKLVGQLLTTPTLWRSTACRCLLFRRSNRLGLPPFVMCRLLLATCGTSC